MYLNVQHVGSNNLLPGLISKLSSMPVGIRTGLKPDFLGETDSHTPHVSIVLIDEQADIAFEAIEQHCVLPGSAPTIVIDARYDPAYRVRYLDMGLMDYLDYAAFDIDALGRTVDIADRAQHFFNKNHAASMKFSELCDTMQVGTWEWNLRRNSFAWSARQFALFGIDPALPKLMYEDWRDAIHPHDRERVEAELGRAIVGQADYHSVFRIYKDDDKGQAALHWIEGVGKVQRDAQGAALSMYGLNWDVTSKHKALADLEAQRSCHNCLSHQSKNTFQTYFEQSNDCLVYLTETPDGRLIYSAINQSGLDHAKLTLEEVLGRTPTDILGAEVGAVIEDAMRMVIRTRKPHLYKPTFEMGGTTVMYDAAYIPITDGGGSVLGVLGSAKDITTTRRMEDVLVRAQKLEALGHIASGTAHDFNNVLQSMTSALGILEHSDAPAPRQRAIQLARLAVKSGQALTSSLLSFARREVLVISPANLNQIVEDTREMIRLTVGPKIKVDIDTDPALWPALVSEQQIELAIINLAVNARDAMPDGGVLTVATRNVTVVESGGDLPPGHLVKLTVTDTGTGMAPDVLARATEAFYTTKSAGQGTGLGLSMVRSTTESMGGALRIASVPGQGTTVSVYLARSDLEPD